MIWRTPVLLLTMLALTPCAARPPADVGGGRVKAAAEAIHAYIIDEARKQLGQAGDHETH